MNELNIASMTQAEKDALGQKLFANIQETQALMQRLGLTNGPEQRKTAPDGGPVSSAHKFLSTQLVQTISVRLRKIGKPPAIIRRVDFDPKRHELVDEEDGSPRKRSDD